MVVLEATRVGRAKCFLYSILRFEENHKDLFYLSKVILSLMFSQKVSPSPLFYATESSTNSNDIEWCLSCTRFDCIYRDDVTLYVYLYIASIRAWITQCSFISDDEKTLPKNLCSILLLFQCGGPYKVSRLIISRLCTCTHFSSFFIEWGFLIVKKDISIGCLKKAPSAEKCGEIIIICRHRVAGVYSFLLPPVGYISIGYVVDCRSIWLILIFTPKYENTHT